MKVLNKLTAPKAVAPEKIIQFGEGNFLRAFVDWIVKNMNDTTDFNASVVVLQGTRMAFPMNLLQGQDCMYHVNLQGRLNGEVVNSLTRIDCLSRGLNPYEQFDAYMGLADQPEIRFVISNTTEAGITFNAESKFTDTPCENYPARLTQLLYRRFKTFNGAADKGLIIMPCELIFENGHHLKDCSTALSTFGKRTSAPTMRHSRIGSIHIIMYAPLSLTVSFRDSPARKSTRFRKNSVTRTMSLYRARLSTSGLSRNRKTCQSRSFVPSSPLRRQVLT